MFLFISILTVAILINLIGGWLFILLLPLLPLIDIIAMFVINMFIDNDPE